MPFPGFKDKYHFLSFGQSNPDHYTFDPRYGHVDTDAFSQGQACWRPLIGEIYTEQATLILCAYFFSQWEDEKITALQILLNQLIDEGFSLYQWHSGAIRPLDKVLIEQFHEDRNAPRYSVPTHDGLMDYIRLRTDLLETKVCLLDDYKIDWLLSGKRKAPQRILMSRYFNEYRFGRDPYISYLHALKPAVSEIRLTSYTPHELTVFTKLKRAFPNATYSYHYHTLTLSTLGLNQLVNTGALTQQGVLFSNVSLPFIKKLTLLLPTQHPNVLAVLQRTSKLTHLVLTQQGTFPEGSFTPLDLQELTQLTLDGGCISAASLSSLMTSAPNLKTLSIKDCVIIGDMVPADFLRLERINLSNQRISFERLLELSIERQRVMEAETEDDEMQDDLSDDSEPIRMPRPIYNQAQTLIIEKLSLYLELTQQDLSIVPLIQVGICWALVQLFKDTVFDVFRSGLLLVSAWNRSQESLSTDLTQIFNQLRHYIKTYQLNQTIDQIYLGNALPLFLERGHIVGATYILTNHKHAVSIRFQGDDSWLYYDPNCFDGIREIKTARLVEALNNEQGSLISISDNNDGLCNDLPSSGLINNPVQFIQEGGLIKLAMCKNAEDLLRLLPSPAAFFLKDLNGLFVCSGYGAPAWLTCITQKNQSIIDYAMGLISVFMSQNPSFQTVFYDSLKCISLEYRKLRLEQLTRDLNASDSPFNTEEHRRIIYQLQDVFLQYSYDQCFAVMNSSDAPLSPEPAPIDNALHNSSSIYQGYSLQTLLESLEFDTEPRDGALILNPTTFDSFFHRCHFENNHFNPLIGYIQAASEGPLFVRLTRALSKQAWTLLLSICLDFRVKLICSCSPGIFLPEEFLIDDSVDDEDDPIDYILAIESPWNTEVGNASLVIRSTDTDTSVALLTRYDSNYRVIDVSGYVDNELDLFEKIRGVYNYETSSFEYTCVQGWLAKALEGGKRVILKGHFSRRLCDALAPILLLPGGPGSALILVTDDTHYFNYFRVQVHNVSVACKRAVLNAPWFKQRLNTLLGRDENEVLDFSVLDDDDIEAEPLSKLMTSLLQEHTREQRRVMRAAIIRSKDFNPEDSEAQATMLIQNRQNIVLFILRYAPILILSGPTGAGKTTFVLNHLNTCSVHTNILDWANKKPLSNDQFIILLIDNLDSNDMCFDRFDYFEGLASASPGIFIDGDYYYLSSQHKVVFVLSPKLMTAKALLVSLFERHAYKETIRPLSPNFIYDRILKPLFKSTRMESDSVAIIRIFFEVCRYINQLPSGNAYMTPRDLEMMGLLLLSRYARYPLENKRDTAKYYAYVLGRLRLSPEQYSAFDARFLTKPPFSLEIRSMNAAASTAFLLTPSRYFLRAQLMDVLALREYRLSSVSSRDVFNHVGLGAVILEGPIGCGKKALMKAILMDAGYQQGDLNLLAADEGHSSAQYFYLMPSDLPLHAQKRVLYQAFYAGAVVLADGIDYSVHESDLNSLLMGTTPMGKRPVKPGFLLIASNNPLQQAPGLALSSRALKIQVPEYTRQEMRDILMRLGLSEPSTECMILSYERQVAKSLLTEQSPFSFHMLIRLTKMKLEYLRRSEAGSEVSGNDAVNSTEPNQVDLTEPDTHLSDNDETDENMHGGLLNNDPLPVNLSPLSKRQRLMSRGFFRNPEDHQNPDRQEPLSEQSRKTSLSLESTSEHLSPQP